MLRCNYSTVLVLCLVILDVGACEFINKSKIKMEFEDQLHTEHSEDKVLLLSFMMKKEKDVFNFIPPVYESANIKRLEFFKCRTRSSMCFKRCCQSLEITRSL